MSGKRVYGTVVHNGLRHEASGVIGGTFAKTKDGWDTNTVCGKYVQLEVETGEDLVINCIRCLGRKRGGSYKDILRGMTADVVQIDEAQDFDVAKLFAEGIPSVLRRPSPAERRASRRLRSRG